MQAPQVSTLGRCYSSFILPMIAPCQLLRITRMDHVDHFPTGRKSRKFGLRGRSQPVVPLIQLRLAVQKANRQSRCLPCFSRTVVKCIFLARRCRPLGNGSRRSRKNCMAAPRKSILRDRWIRLTVPTIRGRSYRGRSMLYKIILDCTVTRRLVQEH